MPNLNLKLNDEAWKVLNELAKKTGRPKTEVLRNALMLIKIAKEEEAKNHSVAIVDNETEKVAAKLVNIL